MKNLNIQASIAGPFDQTGLNPSQRERATAYLRRVEVLVELLFEAAASLKAVALLVASGFNLTRNKLRITDFGAATTRLIG